MKSLYFFKKKSNHALQGKRATRLVPLASANGGHAHPVWPVVAAALDVLYFGSCYAIDDLHRSLERQRLAKGLALHPTDSGRLAGGVQRGEIGHPQRVRLVPLVQWIVEHPEFIHVYGSRVVGVHGNILVVVVLLVWWLIMIIKVMEDDRGRPIALEAFLVLI